MESGGGGGGGGNEIYIDQREIIITLCNANNFLSFNWLLLRGAKEKRRELLGNREKRPRRERNAANQISPNGNQIRNRVAYFQEITNNAAGVAVGTASQI